MYSDKPKPRKDEDLRISNGGSVWSIFQEVQRVHELEFSYAYFFSIVMLLFMLIIHKLCFSEEAMLRGFMLLSNFYTSTNKFVTLLLCLYVYLCSNDVMVQSIFYASKRKHCHVSVILSHGSISSTDS